MAQQAEGNRGAEPNVEIRRDLVYGKGGDTPLHLDLFTPAGPGPFPCVVAIHGGGWKGGSYRDGTMQRFCQEFAKRGMAAASVQYRLTPSGSIWPAQIEDCKAAVRYLKANGKEQRIDPARFGAIGGSAGGHLVLMLGLTTRADGLEGKGDLTPEQAAMTSDVQAVVNVFGPTDLTRRDWEPAVEQLLVEFLGGKLEDRRSEYKAASPLSYLRKDGPKPPILTFHGTKDNIVPFVHATRLAETCKAVGLSHELVTMTGDGHGWGGAKLDDSVKRSVAFFEKHLKAKAGAGKKPGSR
jgi:acetyl esterase/lipase